MNELKLYLAICTPFAFLNALICGMDNVLINQKYYYDKISLEQRLDSALLNKNYYYENRSLIQRIIIQTGDFSEGIIYGGISAYLFPACIGYNYYRYYNQKNKL